MIFVVLALAVWRLSSLIARESGPFDLFTKLRHFLGVRFDEKSEPIATNSISEGVLCMWCNSIWVGLFASLLISDSIADVVINTLAFSAITILIEDNIL